MQQDPKYHFLANPHTELGFVDSSLLGYGQRNALPSGPTSAGCDAAKNKSFAFHPDSGGIQMDIEYPATNAQIGHLHQANLAKIGVNARLEPAEGPAFTQAVVSQKYYGIALTGTLQIQLQMCTQVFGPFYTQSTNWAGCRDDQCAALAHNVNGLGDTVSKALSVTPTCPA
jgi:hypothetical protein